MTSDVDLWIIGPGRMGLALGSELINAGYADRLLFIGRRVEAPAHPLFTSAPPSYASSIPAGDASPRLILIATSDSALGDVVAELAHRFSREGLANTVVLHTSGALGADELSPLSRIGASTGSLHPLVSVADPLRDGSRLRGAWYGVEGDANAVASALEIVEALAGHPLETLPGRKPLYHAAAVFASNYIVSVMSVAERLMVESGVDELDARSALSGLAAGTLANVAAVGPVEALTGPVSRGDAVTVRRHLERLSVPDRLLYSGLAREALHLGVARNLPADAAKRIDDLLESELP